MVPPKMLTQMARSASPKVRLEVPITIAATMPTALSATPAPMSDHLSAARRRPTAAPFGAAVVSGAASAMAVMRPAP